MADSNVNLVRAMFDGYVGGNIDAWFDGIHEDFEFHVTGAFLEPGIVVGLPAYRAYAERGLKKWPDLRMSGESWHEAPGGEVVLVADASGGSDTDEDRLRHRVAYVITLKDGRIYRMFEYINPAAAKRAVGL